MATFARDEYEAKLAAALGSALQKTRNAIMRKLGNPPPRAGLLDSDWSAIADDMRAELFPAILSIYTDSAVATADEFSFGTDWAVFNNRASDWASQYTFDLVKGITDTSKTALQKAISGFYDHNLTLGELKDSLTPAFGPVRAELIAATETTRARSQGEQALIDEMGKHGAKMVAVWQTENDEIVKECPICFPLHGKQQGDGWDELPPAHPRCRCWVNFVPESALESGE